MAIRSQFFFVFLSKESFNFFMSLLLLKVYSPVLVPLCVSIFPKSLKYFPGKTLVIKCWNESVFSFET